MDKTTEKPPVKDTPGGSPQTALPAEPPGNPKILYLALISFFFCFAIWALYAPFGPYFKKWYNLSAGQALILVAIPALLGSVMRIPIGILADKYGAKIIFTMLLFFVIFPLIGAIFVDSYFMFLICGLFFGMSGTSFILGITHVSVWYPQSKQGTVLGIYGIGNIGTIMATIFVPLLINKVFGDPAVGPPKIMIGPLEGWHLIFGIYAIPALVMGIIYWVATSEPPTRPKPKTFGQIFSVYRSSGLAWIFSFLYWMTFGGFVAFSLFSPTYFNDRWDIDRAQASMVYTTIFVIITALIRIVGGLLSDRINPRKILIVTYSISIVALVVMTMEVSFTVQIVSLYVLGFCCGIGNACIFKLIPSYFTAVGAVGGLAGAMGGTGGFCMPIVMGMIKDFTGSYKYGFGVWVAIAVASLVIVLTPKLFVTKKDSVVPKHRVGVMWKQIDLLPFILGLVGLFLIIGGVLAPFVSPPVPIRTPFTGPVSLFELRQDTGIIVIILACIGIWLLTAKRYLNLLIPTGISLAVIITVTFSYINQQKQLMQKAFEESAGIITGALLAPYQKEQLMRGLQERLGENMSAFLSVQFDWGLGVLIPGYVLVFVAIAVGKKLRQC